VIDVRWHPLGEKCPQDRVGERLVVEEDFKPVQAFVTAGMVVQTLRRHVLILRSRPARRADKSPHQGIDVPGNIADPQ
jgi:hypothetical protein